MLSWRTEGQLLYSTLDGNACAPLEGLHKKRYIWYSGRSEYYRRVKISRLFVIATLSMEAPFTKQRIFDRISGYVECLIARKNFRLPQHIQRLGPPSTILLFCMQWSLSMYFLNAWRRHLVKVETCCTVYILNHFNVSLWLSFYLYLYTTTEYHT